MPHDLRACPERPDIALWAGSGKLCRKEETIMGLDWESLLDAENDDLQAAYEDLIFDAMEREDAELEWKRRVYES